MSLSASLLISPQSLLMLFILYPAPKSRDMFKFSKHFQRPGRRFRNFIYTESLQIFPSLRLCNVHDKLFPDSKNKAIDFNLDNSRESLCTQVGTEISHLKNLSSKTLLSDLLTLRNNKILNFEKFSVFFDQTTKKLQRIKNFNFAKILHCFCLFMHLSLYITFFSFCRSPARWSIHQGATATI